MTKPVARCLRRLATSVASAIVLLALVPAAASAITISDFMLGSGATSAGAPPGSVAFSSRVTIGQAGGGTAGSFAYAYNPSMTSRTCVNQSGTGTKTFNVVFPQEPGVYTIYFQSYSGSNCAGTANLATPYASASAVRVTSPAANPELKRRCGLNVVLVLDESGSIAVTSGATAHVRAAATAFVEALSGTGSRVAIVAFSRTARIGVQYDIVNQGSLSTFTNFINSGYHPVNDSAHAGTNWQDAFEKVKELNAAVPANLVVFVTDGDPNTFNNASGGVTTGQDGSTQAMIPAAATADQVKAEGSRVFAVGVGAAVDNAQSAARLTAISGDRKFVTGGDFATSDYTVVSDFADLADKLREIVTGACAPSLTITKWIAAPGDTTYTSDAPGWNFTATLSTSSGSHHWVEPTVSPADAPSATAITNDDGVAAFKWSATDPTATSTLHVVETQMPGYAFVKADCQIRHGATTTDLTSMAGVPSITLGPDEFAICSVYNQGPVAHLTVVKRLIPSTDPGRFDLLVDGEPQIEQVGDGGSTGQLTLGLGTHMVSERVTAAEDPTVTLDQYAISTSCVNETTGAVVASGTGSASVSVTLATASDDVVCTITNERTAEPPPDITPPEPPIVPPDPCSDSSSHLPGCSGDEPGTMVPQTSLAVTKRMPAHAHVGDVLPIVITVKNVGTETAENVVLRDTPPGAGRIVHARGFHATRHKDGTVTWSLGDLAPGATRTVHAMMLITRGGSLLNHAVAGADNADVVGAAAAVRAATPTLPVVTG